MAFSMTISHHWLHQVSDQARRCSPRVGPVSITSQCLHDGLDFLVGQRITPSALAAESEASQKLLWSAAIADGKLGSFWNVFRDRECDLCVTSAIDHIVDISNRQACVVETRCNRVNGNTLWQLEAVNKCQPSFLFLRFRRSASENKRNQLQCQHLLTPTSGQQSVQQQDKREQRSAVPQQQ